MDDLGDVIAIRSFEMGSRPIEVRVARPFQTPGHNDYTCRYQIVGFKSSRICYSVGIDSMQALMLALQAIGSDLYSSKEKVTRFGEDDLGLPVLPGMREHLPPGNDYWS
jgi:hypothetical protein